MGVVTRCWQRHEQVDDSELVDRKGEKTPEGLLEGDRMFDECVAGVRQSRIADILLELDCKITGSAIEDKPDD